jgi:protein-tyrosine-phosphatase
VPPELEIQRAGDRLYGLHLHDVAAEDPEDSHWVPGMGGLDWEAIRDSLRSIHYTGCAGFEALRGRNGESPDTVARMTRDFAVTRFSIPYRMGIVCHGNIARSQVLHHYLDREVRARNLPVTLTSCGTAERDAYDSVEELLADVGDALRKRGVEPRVERTWWSEEARKQLLGADWILAADEDRKQDLLDRLDDRQGEVSLFYAFIGEGEVDFVDTYDHDQGFQNEDRFEACFSELERIAVKVAERLEVLLS